MENITAARPASIEYAPYYGKYISLVPEGDVVVSLSRQLESTLAVLQEIPEERADTRYAEGKWSIKELLGHISDTERIFGYRALRFARNDQTPLSGFEQDGYVLNSNFGAYRLSELADEFAHVRRANLSLFRHLDREAWLRSGEASGAQVSVRALAYIIAGHEAHHIQILRERYL
ncbi:MAG TPA: DinB family protein [Pyrinomonadaceae bacterium]|jgi:uncharacterized damage-inducible protein DinB